MRYTWIDGMYMEIECCGKCPFYSTEYELGAECKYPHKPSKEDRYYPRWEEGVAEDCPLRGKA